MFHFNKKNYPPKIKFKTLKEQLFILRHFQNINNLGLFLLDSTISVHVLIAKFIFTRDFLFIYLFLIIFNYVFFIFYLFIYLFIYLFLEKDGVGKVFFYNNYLDWISIKLLYFSGNKHVYMHKNIRRNLMPGDPVCGSLN